MRFPRPPTDEKQANIVRRSKEQFRNEYSLAEAAAAALRHEAIFTLWEVRGSEDGEGEGGGEGF